MTDDTRDRDRPFADAGEPSETTGDEQTERAATFDRADRTRGETARTAEAGGTTGTARATGATGTTETTETPEATRSRADQTAVTEPTGGPSAEVGTEPPANQNAEPDSDRLEERLRAVERALTGTGESVADLGDEASASAEREELSARLDDLETRVEELEAATQAIRGYVGSIRAVNQTVERRADLALAKASENGGETAGGSKRVPDRETSLGGDTPGNDDTPDSEVPSEAALDAAVPADRRRGHGTEPTSGPAVDRAETDGEKADGSWRDGALDRLRDSL